MSKFGLAFVATIVAMFAVVQGFREASLARLSTFEDYEIFELLRVDELQPSLSNHGNRILLLACDDALSGRMGDLQPPVILEEIASRCANPIREISAGAPTWALPRYMSAVISHRLGESAEAAEDIIRSRELGPYESWIGERRATLAMKLPQSQDAHLERYLKTELSTLLVSPLGRDYVARLFVADPERRVFITKLVEQTGPGEQSGFLSSVKREQQRIGAF